MQNIKRFFFKRRANGSPSVELVATQSMKPIRKDAMVKNNLCCLVNPFVRCRECSATRCEQHGAAPYDCGTGVWPDTPIKAHLFESLIGWGPLIWTKESGWTF